MGTSALCQPAPCRSVSRTEVSDIMPILHRCAPCNDNVNSGNLPFCAVAEPLRIHRSPVLRVLHGIHAARYGQPPLHGGLRHEEESVSWSFPGPYIAASHK